MKGMILLFLFFCWVMIILQVESCSGSLRLKIKETISKEKK